MIVRFLVVTFVTVLMTQAASTAYARMGDADSSKDSHTEPRPYDKTVKAWDSVDQAFARARHSQKRVMLVMGANWCHDSRALAGHFETPKFQTLIHESYELVYVDVGQKNRNTDIAQVYGIDSIVGTPTVMILSPEGVLLNASTAPTWRNAASRTQDDVFIYFSAYASGDIIENE